MSGKLPVLALVFYQDCQETINEHYPLLAIVFKTQVVLTNPCLSLISLTCFRTVYHYSLLQESMIYLQRVIVEISREISMDFCRHLVCADPSEINHYTSVFVQIAISINIFLCVCICVLALRKS